MANRVIERFIALYKLMYSKTDAQHMMTRKEIIDQLKNQGIEMNRQTFSSLLKVMKENQIDIMEEKSDHYRYCIAERSFDLAEVKLIMDAILSTSAIDEFKSQQLIQKLKLLLSSNQASEVSRELLPVYRKKQYNRYFYQNMDVINEAIAMNKKIRFQYFTYIVNDKNELQKVSRKAGKEYIVSPYSFCWEQDNYYVLVSDDRHEGLASYRIDRMNYVKLSKENRKALTDCHLGDLQDLSRYVSKMFSMHSGENGEWIKAELEFDEKVLNVIVDKFGEFTVYRRNGSKIIANFDVIISPVFFSWIFQLGEQICIKGPITLVEAYKNFLNHVLQRYSNK